MAKHNLRLIRDVGASSVRLLAHSFGGVVLYEMLRQLKKRNIKITELFLLDSYATIFQKKIKVKDRIKLFIYQLGLTANEADDLSVWVANKPKKDRVKLLYNYVVSQGISMEEDYFYRLWHLYEVSMNSKYSLSDTLNQEVTLVKACESYDTTAGELLGWSNYYKNVRGIKSTGDHFSMVKEPHCSEWVKKLKN